MSERDGGSAFPMQFDDVSSQFGMTLRDYFAAKAMQAAIISMGDESSRRYYQNRPSIDVPSKIAEGAYVVADAMLKERGK